VAVANGLQESDALKEGQLMKITIEEPYEGKPQR
jgi:hypothetical protein